MTTTFNITNPDAYICRVIGYMKSHSFLEIRITRQDFGEVQDTLYLEFEGVEYYEGPMGWRGADFKTGSTDACLEIIHRLGRYAGLPDDFLLGKLKLFIAPIITDQNIEQEVKILAMNGGVSKVPSPFFKPPIKDG